MSESASFQTSRHAVDADGWCSVHQRWICFPAEEHESTLDKIAAYCGQVERGEIVEASPITMGRRIYEIMQEPYE